jgi:hypothetical protein
MVGRMDDDPIDGPQPDPDRDAADGVPPRRETVPVTPELLAEADQRGATPTARVDGAPKSPVDPPDTDPAR